MLNIYPYVLILHLFCAIFFVGFLFTDIFFLKYSKKNTILNINNAFKIMPCIVLILFISGLYLAYFHLNLLNWLFITKIFFALCIFILILFSLFYKIILKKQNPLHKNIHPIIFIFTIIIIICAKLMFYIAI
ncbi:putative membrane protein [Campylobacter insulaenigrae NCTC 12927]|uniref:Putative membrane protein n=1 Tax=Campylobacter insulaenigrae NCTC 12927 TaxID=1031564 RepID=A0A0A8H4S2_9BACT|nr:putative membrane protein [Campylobacter insulaenigrae NCTC 12927]VEH94350.1 membrane protein [Campylobacter insulaenigrae]VEJ54056.1 membrane protein [Campylobacter insulaenigrae]